MVNEKGLKLASSIGDCTFGIGIILDSFETTGTTPDWSDVLKIVVIGSASSYANSLTLRHGTLSGPMSLSCFVGEQLLTNFMGLHS